MKKGYTSSLFSFLHSAFLILNFSLGLHQHRQMHLLAWGGVDEVGANFAAGVIGGVDVDVDVPGQERVFDGLSIGQAAVLPHADLG